jgi:urease accessory protein
MSTNLPVLTSAPLQQVHGQLQLHFTWDPARQLTALRSCTQVQPLQVIKPFSLTNGTALLHLHNLSGGVLSGDQLSLDVEVGPAARVQLTTTSATRLYRSRPGVPPARQDCHVLVRQGGLLEYVPDQLIPFAGAQYQQSTRIELEQDAGLFWWETLAPGRLARGECFAYQHLQFWTDISAETLPIACERFNLIPQLEPLSSSARLGQYLYHSSFFICRVGLPATRWLELEEALARLADQLTRQDDTLWGVSTLVAHGLLVRAVSRRGYDLAPGLLAFWHAARLALYGERAIPPRKVL